MRIRIELGTREPLPLGIKVRKRFGEQELLPIKIESLCLFSFKCGRLGHNGFNCSLGPTFNPRVVDNRKRRYNMTFKGVTPIAKYPIYTSPISIRNLDDCDKPTEENTNACNMSHIDNLKASDVLGKEHGLLTTKHAEEDKIRDCHVGTLSST